MFALGNDPREAVTAARKSPTRNEQRDILRAGILGESDASARITPSDGTRKTREENSYRGDRRLNFPRFERDKEYPDEV